MLESYGERAAILLVVLVAVPSVILWFWLRRVPENDVDPDERGW